jgi:hypothetical protein
MLAVLDGGWQLVPGAYATFVLLIADDKLHHSFAFVLPCYCLCGPLTREDTATCLLCVSSLVIILSQR